MTHDGTSPKEFQTRPPHRLLLVDDDESQCDAFRIRLERRGYKVHVVHRAEKALETAREVRPDAIVLDIAMPERDGLSVLQELLDVDPSLPVIIHTAYPAYADDFMAWAADAYVIKTQDIDVLVTALETALVPRAGTSEPAIR